MPDTYCVSGRAGAGALGYPHFNHAHGDSPDPEKPTALLYEDDASGRRRLGALECHGPGTETSRRTTTARACSRQPFKGPVPGRFKGQKVPYALHVWLCKPNPAGMVATYNPEVRCRPGTTRP
ncbi:hypothetical protein [Streptomyces sp. NPDC002587]